MKTIFQPLNDKRLVALSALIFGLFFLLAMLKPSGIFWSLDEGGKWLYIENVLRTGNPQSPMIYPGRPLDSNLQNVALFYYARVGDQFYTWWPVNFPLLTLPLYKIFGWAGLYLLPALAGALTAFLSGCIAKILSNQARYVGEATALLVALGTPIAFYSTTFWEHTLATACFMLMFYLLLVTQNTPGWKSLLIAGISGSLAFMFRTEVGLVILGMGLMLLLVDWRRAIPFGLSGGVVTTLWVLTNLWITGYAFGNNVSSIQTMPNFRAVSKIGWELISYVLFNAPYTGALSLPQNLMIFGSLAAGLTLLLGLFPKTRWAAAFSSLAVIAICVDSLLKPALYRSIHGFLLICPLVLFCSWIYATPAWKKYKKMGWLYLGGLAVYAVVYTVRAWIAAGGLQWGPRYMLTFYPILTITVVVGIQEFLFQQNTSPARWKKFILTGIVALAILVGIGYQVRGYITMYLNMDVYRRSANTLRGLKDQVLLTNCTWMPMVIPDLYWNGNIFSKEPSQQWLDQLKQAGYSSYLFVTLASCDIDSIDQELKAYQADPDGLDIEIRLLER